MSKGRQRWHCRACDKTAYGSEGRALETMQRVAEASDRDRVPIRAYECPYNPGTWHLTSQQERIDCHG